MRAPESPTLLGFHHVTAICRDAQSNLDFYVGVLGLRLVKLTVNFDDPSAYHFYYGDGAGNPGTILTFFPYPRGNAAIVGQGQVHKQILAVPEGSIPFWADRLGDRVTAQSHNTVDFVDPDGIYFQLRATSGQSAAAEFPGARVEAAHAIIGIHTVQLCVSDLAPTKELLTQGLGFELLSQNGNSTVFGFQDAGNEQTLEVVENPSAPHSRGGPGSVHHVAFRTATVDDQPEWKSLMYQAEIHTSPLMDRDYFRSVYFREPGGVLFEIATDPPGFTVDEPLESLGTRLCLPFTLEGSRIDIEAKLPPIVLPT